MGRLNKWRKWREVCAERHQRDIYRRLLLCWLRVRAISLVVGKR